MASVEKMLPPYSAVVLTGGSSGIGKSFVEHIGRLCPDAVICNLSRREPGREVRQLNLRHVPCDLSDRAALAAAIPQVLAILNECGAGPILLINNSGFGAYGTFPEARAERLAAMIEVNIAAPVALAGALLPALRARGGAIINVASTAAFQPTAYLPTYGATKAFLLHWSLALGEELRASNVQVLTLCPGPTATPFFAEAGLGSGEVPGGAGQTPDEVVQDALAGLARRRRLVVCGFRNRWLAAASSMLPRRWSAWAAARILERYRRRPGS